jgi:Hemerythrin HHE cation binding domain
MDYKLDMSVMLTFHVALRRDLEQVARVAGRRDKSAGTRLRIALGWEQFKRFLVIHHQAEDDFLWPVLLAKVTEHPDQVALVDALEAEHAVIEPLLAAVDAAAGDPDDGGRLGDVIDELVTKLAGHLGHEESEGFPLIDASLDPEEWQRFGRLHGQRLLGDAPVYVPWLLEGADKEDVDGFLAKIPPPLATAYHDEWAPAYAASRRWDHNDETVRTSADDS